MGAEGGSAEAGGGDASTSDGSAADLSGTDIASAPDATAGATSSSGTLGDMVGSALGNAISGIVDTVGNALSGITDALGITSSADPATSDGSMGGPSANGTGEIDTSDPATSDAGLVDFSDPSVSDNVDTSDPSVSDNGDDSGGVNNSTGLSADLSGGPASDSSGAGGSETQGARPPPPGTALGPGDNLLGISDDLWGHGTTSGGQSGSGEGVNDTLLTKKTGGGNTVMGSTTLLGK